MNLPSVANECFAVLFGVCVTFGPAQATEPDPTEELLDKGISLMQKAVEEAEKGNFVLGSPYEVCPGAPPVENALYIEGDRCEHPSFSCRCF